MELSNFKNILLISSLLLTGIVACKRENQVDVNSPAYQISESEKLVIPATVALPANAPAGNKRVATFYAKGVQIYKGKLKAGTTATFEWALVAPRADLFNASNAKVGTHTAGPTWQLSPADSIYAQHFMTPKTAPGPDGSIDWLLLTPKKEPTGVFTNVSYVQRIATTGGKAPGTPPASATETVEVPYTAIYRFTKIN